MRASTTHFVTALAITAAAVVTAFAIPLPARAVNITIIGDASNFVSGSGKEVNVARKVGSFTALRIDSSIDVTAHPGQAVSVTVHADDNIVPLIETVIDGDTLVIRLKPDASFRTRAKLSADVTFTALTATRQHGSGNLHITALDSPRLDATIAGSGDLHIDNAKLGSFSASVAGSGDIAIAGSADEARFAVAGSGDIHAARLVARRVTASISGSGDAQVNATESLAASVAGTGDITYIGHPREVSRNISGQGSIEAAN